MKKVALLLVIGIIALGCGSAEARTRLPRASKSTKLSDVCKKIVNIDERKQFYKNNKPMRASSAINAPVIGYFRQMTLANNAGVRSSIGAFSTKMYDRKGNTLSNMTPYPCRSDHCGGRVVSVTQTHIARRAAMSRTNSPVGYVKISSTTCMKIPDIGRCYGVEVNKTRPLCNQTVK